MPRPRTSAYLGLSLDGFLAAADGSLDWLTPFQGVEAGFDAFLASVDTLLLGRKTYAFVEQLVRGGAGWPYEGKRVAVLTHRPLTPLRDEVAVCGPLPEVLDGLGEAGAAHVYLDGGQVVRAALAGRLLNELTVSIVPRLLGTGLSLFGGVAVSEGVELVEARALDRGMAQLRYRFARG